jgi:hypothetical protein
LRRGEKIVSYIAIRKRMSTGAHSQERGLVGEEYTVKSWNYVEVTAEAEHRIMQLMTASRDRAPEESAHFRQLAHGVFVLWDGLTQGWRPSHDYGNDQARLLRLLGPYQFPWREQLGIPADA